MQNNSPCILKIYGTTDNYSRPLKREKFTESVFVFLMPEEKIQATYRSYAYFYWEGHMKENYFMKFRGFHTNLYYQISTLVLRKPSLPLKQLSKEK